MRIAFSPSLLSTSYGIQFCPGIWPGSIKAYALVNTDAVLVPEVGLVDIVGGAGEGGEPASFDGKWFSS